jgi:pimeloyl-ACP methyl ester carboxylesterase
MTSADDDRDSAVDTLRRHNVEVAGREVPLYESAGDGTVQLVMLHGGFTDPLSDFGSLLPHLDPRLSLSMPVIAGHGGRPAVAGETIGPVSIAHELRALADAMQWPQPVLGGFSLGARAAMLAAALGVETAGLVLLGTRFGAFSADEFAALERRATRYWPEWAGSERREALAAMAAGIVDFEIEPERWAAELPPGLPVLAVRGEDDRITSARELAAFETLPVDARVLSVPGHGHRVQDTAPADVAALINNFLTEAGAFS